TEKITVYASYTTECVHPFTDLKEGSYYIGAVEWALMNGVMNGTSATGFNPDGVTDRAMIVTVLYRLAGSPDVSDVVTPFTDVKAGEWYADAIAWAYENKVVNGNTATTFNPKGHLTREQFATILYRYAKEVEGQDVSVDDTTALDKYTDKGDVSGYALDAVLWANVRGLIGGVSAAKLSPGSGATRAQMATILHRYNV
ncbi:MAG: S-layer homology domain-containing protein, partial [Clostridia bacterium]|nr:S-layer homology domain-containing protein [Clostridia bacterium]